MTNPQIIRLATAPTLLGEVLAAMTERGLCVLQLVTRPGTSAVLKELKKQFPRAQFRDDPEGLAPVFQQVNDLIVGRRQESEIPLDMGGTPFQQTVWHALRTIPRGSTCSYSELARRIGKPRAVRAVASTAPRNPVAFLVPCHRIVRRDGSLGGYGGGKECKRQLLQWEREESSTKDIKNTKKKGKR